MNQAQIGWLEGVVREGYDKSAVVRRLTGLRLADHTFSKKFPALPDFGDILSAVKAAMKPDQVELMMAKGDWQFGVEPNLKSTCRYAPCTPDNAPMLERLLRVRFPNAAFDGWTGAEFPRGVREKFEINQEVRSVMKGLYPKVGEVDAFFEGIFYPNKFDGEGFNNTGLPVRQRADLFAQFSQQNGALGVDLPAYFLMIERSRTCLLGLFIDQLPGVKRDDREDPIVGCTYQVHLRNDWSYFSAGTGVRRVASIISPNLANTYARLNVSFCPTFRVKLT